MFASNPKSKRINLAIFIDGIGRAAPYFGETSLMPSQKTAMLAGATARFWVAAWLANTPATSWAWAWAWAWARRRVFVDSKADV
jgi:hypothetical protein